MQFSPHKYQYEVLKFCLERGGAGMLLDPGLGKTPTTYMLYEVLRRKHYVQKMLVIAPLRVATSVWPREAKKWDNFNHLRVVVLHGPKKEELLESDADVYVINPDGLEWLFGGKDKKTNQWKTGAADRFFTWPWQMLVVDESTQFKNTQALRTQILKRRLNNFKRRFILTGSPAPNGLLDLFGQIYILDQGGSLGRFISHYRQEFFDQTGFGGHTWIPRKGAAEKIYERISPLTIRMSAEDHLDLPPLVYNTVEVELPDDARRIYRQMEELMLAEVSGDMVTAANAAAATIKCRQIANGGLYVPTEDETEPVKTEHIHKAKIEALQDLVEELNGKPAFIAYEFQHDLERLQKAFPDAPYLGGGVTATQQAKIEDAWNRGELPVLFAQPQSVAHGLNLQGTHAAVVWHSLTWNLEHYEQFIRRIWRQGQTGSVMVHHLIAKDTIDEVMLETLGKKDKTQQSLLTALRDYAERRRAA